MWGETSGIKGHLRIDMDSYLLKYMQLILVSPSNNEDTESQLTISCCQARLPVVGLGYIRLSCWPRGPNGNPMGTPKQCRLLPRLLVPL